MISFLVEKMFLCLLSALITSEPFIELYAAKENFMSFSDELFQVFLSK